MSLAYEIRAEMAIQGLKNSDISLRTGIPRSRLSVKLNEHRGFNSEELTAIGNALGIPGSELMRRAETKRRRRPATTPIGKNTRRRRRGDADEATARLDPQTRTEPLSAAARNRGSPQPGVQDMADAEVPGMG